MLFPSLSSAGISTQCISYIKERSIKYQRELEIESDLYHGNIYALTPFTENLNQHRIYTAEVYNHRSGRNLKALLKPRQYGDAGGYGRTPMEYVAYYLNRILKMDYIPPIAYRNASIPGVHEGSVHYFVNNAKLLFETPKEDWGMNPELVKSDHRILNVLLKNPDGHYKNILFGEHWRDASLKPVFVDYSASFKGGEVIRMDHYAAMGTGHKDYSVNVISERTYKALKNLTKTDLSHLIKEGFITELEVLRLLETSKGIIKYFDNLAKTKDPREVILKAYN
jgi:hypothetical protein